MRLKTLDIRGFGQLRGTVDLETGPGTVALLLERNEAGKSTLAAAITAALYGLDSNRTRHRNRMTPVDRYRPWEGGAYGLELLLDRGGRTLRITRDFEQGTVEVHEGARDVIASFRRGRDVEVGEILTGLTRAQFELSAFVPQGAIVWEDASTLAEALQRAADSQSGGSTAAAAIAVLQAELEQYEGLTLKRGRVETEIQRCEAEVARATGELAALDGRREALEHEIEELRRLESEGGEAKIRRGALRLRRAATELGFEVAALAADDERRARRDGLRARLAEDPALERLTGEVRREVDTERRRLGILRGRLQELEAALAEAGRQRDVARRRIGEEPVEVVPTRQQVTELGAWCHTRREILAAREQLRTSLERERERISAAGFDPAQAARLGRRFADLSDRERAMLAGLRKRRLELEDERERIGQRRDSANQDVARVEDARARRRRNGITALLVGVVVGVAGAIGARSAGLPTWTGALPGLALMLAGGWVAATAGGWRSGVESAARARQEELDEESRRLEITEEEVEAGLGSLALRVGCSAEELEESWRAWLDVQPHMSGLTVYEDRLSAFDAEEDRLVEAVRALREIIGREPALDELDAHYEVFLRVRGLADDAEAAEKAHAEILARRQEQAQEIGAAEDALSTRLAGLGVDGVERLEQAFERFEERAARALEVFAIRDTELPQLEQLIANPAQRATREARIAELERRVHEGRPELERALASLGGEGQQLIATLDDPLTEEELQGGLREIEARVERRHDEATRQLTGVRSFVERYEREAPALRDRIGEVEEAGRRAREFAEAITLARDTLDELAQQTHRVWSRELAEHTNRTLVALGSDVGQVEFDEGLEFALVERGRRMDAQQARQALSTGARDLLHLAFRIALARFLSGGDLSLPLILDDPFAHCDDPRTVAGMQLLAESIAPAHQVIVLACQRSRYEWVRRQVDDPHRIHPLALAGPA